MEMSNLTVSKNIKTGMEKREIGKVLFNGDTCIIYRRKRTAKKPALYLWNITKQHYISSLYETGKKNEYWYEWQGVIYLLNSGTGKIKKMEWQRKGIKK